MGRGVAILGIFVADLAFRAAHAGDRRDHRRLGLQDGAGRQGLEPGGRRGARRRRGDLHLADRPRRLRRDRPRHLGRRRHQRRRSQSDDRAHRRRLHLRQRHDRRERDHRRARARPDDHPRRRRGGGRRDPQCRGLRDPARAAGRRRDARPRDRARRRRRHHLQPRPAEPVPDAIYPLCDYVTPNESEASLLTGSPSRRRSTHEGPGTCSSERRRDGAHHARRAGRPAPLGGPVAFCSRLPRRPGGRDRRRRRCLQRRLCGRDREGARSARGGPLRLRGRGHIGDPPGTAPSMPLAAPRSRPARTLASQASALGL